MLSSGCLVLVIYQTRHNINLVVGYATVANTGKPADADAGINATINGREVVLSEDGQHFVSLGVPRCEINFSCLKVGINTLVLGKPGEEDLMREALEVKNMPPGDIVSAIAWPLFCARAMAFRREAQARWAQAHQQVAAVSA